jgi:hypothetical protein
MVAAAVEPAAAALAPLPPPLVHRILGLLPADSLGRAACVARGWRDTLAEPALWTHLGFSAGDEDGDAPALDADALLQGAASRAHGQLVLLDVLPIAKQLTPRVLLAVLAANAGSLRRLRVGTLPLRNDPRDRHGGEQQQPLTLAAILEAAPLLQQPEAQLCADVYCFWDDAPSLLRAEPPFAAVYLQELTVAFGDNWAGGPLGGLARVAPVAAALADAALLPMLEDVHISRADTQQPDVMDALVHAALARRLPALWFQACTPPAAAPLARLLRGGTLAALRWSWTHPDVAPLLDASGAALVADALRATTTLCCLRLEHSGLCRDMRAAGALLRALVGHPSLDTLVLLMEGEREAEDEPETAQERSARRAALGAALAALVAADAPALECLMADALALGDDGLAPLVAALPRNRHLTELGVSNNGMSEAFAQEVLLPAVRANTSLRQLRAQEADEENGGGPAALEAQELVSRR